MDAFFAVIIFTLILVSVYSYFISTQELRQQYFYSEDILDIFVNTKMGELNVVSDPNHYNFNKLNELSLINPDLTIMDQITALQYQGYPEYSQWIFYNLTSDLFGEKYGVSFDVEGLVYQSQKNVTALVARQRFVSGVK